MVYNQLQEHRSFSILVMILASGCGLIPETNGQLTISQVKHANQVASAVNVRAGLADLPTGTSWAGLSVDLTKALAAAILHDKEKIKIEVGDRKTGPAKVKSGEVELYLPVEPLAPSKLAADDLTASRPFFFNVQRIMVRKDSGISSVNQLVGKPIAVQPGYVNEQNFEMLSEEHLRDYFQRKGLPLMVFPFQEWDEMESAFVSGHVEAVSAEESELGRLRAANAEEVGDALMLPEIIGMEPTSAVTRRNDPGWVTLVNATISVLIEADELGISSATVEANKQSKDPEVLYLLGVNPGIGTAVGLDDHWAERVIKAVGNYGEAFKRDLGVESHLGIERGLNEVWRRGGLLYANSIR
jgi:general L-amino acid transport system substrate-binding protein